MSLFSYTATASVQSHHSENEQYSVEFELQTMTPKRTVSRNVAESLSGKRETLKHYAKRSWTLTFAPLRGDELPALHELLDSMEDGQTVQFYCYGNEAAPVSVIRIDEGYSEDDYMQRGREDADLWVISGVELREA